MAQPADQMRIGSSAAAVHDPRHDLARAGTSHANASRKNAVTLIRIVLKSTVELVGVDLEVVGVARRSRPADAPASACRCGAQARALVAREVEAPGARGGTPAAARTPGSSSRRSCDRPARSVTRWTSAEAIWSRGSTSSTHPVWIAAPGMPKKLARSPRSWAITVPPIRLIGLHAVRRRRSPCRVSTTAMARAPKRRPTDSNSRSAEGRDVMHRPVRGQRQTRRRAPTSRCWSGGATKTAPGRKPVAVVRPGMTGRAHFLPRISASMLGRLGSRCCTITTAAGKSAGSPTARRSAR